MTDEQTGLESLRVLVVDDHQGMRDIISTILTGLGVGHVVLTASPDEAIKEMSRKPPDIIFIDWMLGAQDGLRFVRFIRRQPEERNPFVPIVMMTGHADLQHVTQARDAGVTEFLVKPVSPMSVAQRLEALIHHPRAFVRSDRFVGPDRRRRDKPIEGDDRRGPDETPEEPHDD
jgi:two-component system, chemotaxis family, chemotaxis protein CheY